MSAMRESVIVIFFAACTLASIELSFANESSGEISPGYLEIQGWLSEHFEGDLQIERERQYRLSSHSAPGERKTTPEDWDDFVRLNRINCNTETLERMKKMMARSGAEQLRLGESFKRFEPPHPIQKFLLELVASHAHHCPATYEREAMAVYENKQLIELINFVKALDRQARITCGEARSGRSAAVEYQECVERNPQVYTGAIQKLRSKNPKLCGYRRATRIEPRREKVDREVKRILGNCKNFLNLVDFVDLYRRVEYDLETYNHRYSPTFNEIWATYEVCEKLGPKVSTSADTKTKQVGILSRFVGMFMKKHVSA